MNLTKVGKKVVHTDSRKTIYEMHNNVMTEFEQATEKLPEKKRLLEQLIQKQQNMRNKTSDEFHGIQKKIVQLTAEIKNTETGNEESEYLLKASEYLKVYNTGNSVSTNVVNNVPTNNSGTLADFLEIKQTSNKGEMSRHYIQECLSKGITFSTKDKDRLICDECNNKRVIIHKTATAVCQMCGDSIEYQDTTVCTEFSEEIEVLTPYSYKRINHFKEHLAMLQGHGSSTPPQDTINKLLKELKKNRITNVDDVTYDLLKGYLRKLNLNKMYDHIPAIIHNICGLPPVEITKSLEDTLINMFEQVQIPFDKHCPSTRTNFLNYYYTLNKMVQILGHYHLQKHFPLLKNRENLWEQDDIWKNICNELGWKFYPSV